MLRVSSILFMLLLTECAIAEDPVDVMVLNSSEEITDLRTRVFQLENRFKVLEQQISNCNCDAVAARVNRKGSVRATMTHAGSADAHVENFSQSPEPIMVEPQQDMDISKYFFMDVDLPLTPQTPSPRNGARGRSVIVFASSAMI